MKRWIILLCWLFSAGITGAQQATPAAGCILYAPMLEKTTFLVNNAGDVVHTWESNHVPAASVYLLENGLLLRTAHLPDMPFILGSFPGTGGRVEMLNPQSEVVWSFEYAGEHFVTHHDLTPLPSGNILMLAWEAIPVEELIAAGRSPEMIPNGRSHLLSDTIIEVDPTTNEIVWEWRASDHLSLEPDPRKIDINYHSTAVINIDMIYLNGIAYHPQRDWIVVSSRTFSEIWVLDHSITTEEARGAAGDLLFRWGNPAAYGAEGTRQLYYQHHPHWIADGLPGAGNLLIFNNGMLIRRPYSEVLELNPAAYSLQDAPQLEPVWTYRAEEPGDFFSSLISSAQRQPNGNTLITAGLQGHIFEVTAAGEIVLELETGKRIFRAERFAPDYAGLPPGVNCE